MSFSPEANTSASQSSMDIWAKLLDQKLQPLHAKVDKVLSTSSHINDLEKEIKFLKTENVTLKKRLESLESYSRKNNIRIYNLPESRNEDIENVVINLANRHLLHEHTKFDGRTFETVHRLGRAKSGTTRVVIARFCNFKDKKALLSVRKSVKEKEDISMSDDYSAETVQNRREVFPVYKAIQDKLKVNGEPDSDVYLKQDKLYFKGKWYNPDDLENLPSGFSPAELSTPQKNGITAFFSKRSPLSNHYKCEFKLHVETYNCLEQYLMIQKASLFGGQHSQLQKRCVECRGWKDIV